MSAVKLQELDEDGIRAAVGDLLSCALEGREPDAQLIALLGAQVLCDLHAIANHFRGRHADRLAQSEN